MCAFRYVHNLRQVGNRLIRNNVRELSTAWVVGQFE
jgi:hypothetical protein